MCNDLGAKVVAEGIETVDELKAVVDSGAHYGQGFLLARPALPIPEVDWAALEQAAGARPDEPPGTKRDRAKLRPK
jgi:EAL domain-containing protein (putative c-di-GMP-specific phosphodiesterase class I)